MIEEFLNYVGIENIEAMAVQCHRPSEAVYIYVSEQGDYKVITNWEKISYNSKYRGWDYYSQLVSMNKPIASKLIQSNNYNAFWCRNIEKLKNDDIDLYYDKLGYKSWHRDWVKEHIYQIGEQYHKALIKIFFPSTREEYRQLGLENWMEKSISIPNMKNSMGKEIPNGMGVPKGYSVNVKKPYSVGRQFYAVDKERGLQIKMIYDILKGLRKRGYEEIYVNEEGVLATTAAQPVEMDRPPSLFIVTDIDEKGELVIRKCENIPSYRYRL